LGRLRPRELEAIVKHISTREDAESLPPEQRDLYGSEPNLKETVGGLRDYHTALWMLSIKFGTMSLDDLEQLGHIAPDEYLEISKGLDLIWRIRNELHFHSGREDDLLNFDAQRHLAQAFGYGAGSQKSIGLFMQDYYAAARRLRWFFQSVLRLCDQETQMEMAFAERAGPSRSRFTVYRGQLCAANMDDKWFAENPARLMEIVWECARRRAPLSYATQRWVKDSLSHVTYAFRSSPVVRRYFVAICSRPLQAGMALREAAKTELLNAYIPEFAAIYGIIRYEDFHSYPVDEHTLRAIEAIAEIPKEGGSVAGVLQRTLENIRRPHILILSILFHDLGKVAGETHTEEGVRIARTICARMGLPEEDSERIEFLVQHHMLMTNIALYRDTDDVEIVRRFAETVRTDERLRALLLLTYADLSAVAPNVWNDWKAALLLKLYLKTERVLQGRTNVSVEEAFWTLPKAQEVAHLLPDDLKGREENYLESLGERYFVAFSAESIARHLECLEEAREKGLALRCDTHEETGTSEVVVCTRDRHGLFAALTGSFSSQLVDVEDAAPFTTPDGFAVDCFTVKNAGNGQPLTKTQFRAVEKVLRAVLLDGKDIRTYTEQARHRIFALLQPRVPMRTRIAFDNESSATDTVIDIETGDRTGLLYDIAGALSDMGLDISSARITTDARRARDAFYVRLDGNKIEDETAQTSLREGLGKAIQPMKAAGDKGGTK